MSEQSKAAHAGEHEGGQGVAENSLKSEYSSLSSNRQIMRPTGYKTKTAAILHYLTFTGSLNRFDAQRLYDSCLNSTISTLANDYSIVFDKEREEVPNRAGGLSRVIRYKVSIDSKEQALRLLNCWSIKPKVKS